MEFEKIRDIISEVLNINKDQIEADTKFLDLGADSLDLVQIVMEIEETFQITIDDSQLENILTVQDAVEEIKKSIN